jgi:hypothetical protein
MIGGGAVSKVDPDSTGVHPDWRKALAIIILSLPWKEGDPVSTIAGVKKRLRNGLDVLSGLGRGTYFNEVTQVVSLSSYVWSAQRSTRHRCMKGTSRKPSSGSITTS